MTNNYYYGKELIDYLTDLISPITRLDWANIIMLAGICIMILLMLIMMNVNANRIGYIADNMPHNDDKPTDVKDTAKNILKEQFGVEYTNAIKFGLNSHKANRCKLSDIEIDMSDMPVDMLSHTKTCLELIMINRAFKEGPLSILVSIRALGYQDTTMHLTQLLEKLSDTDTRIVLYDDDLSNRLSHFVYTGGLREDDKCMYYISLLNSMGKANLRIDEIYDCYHPITPEQLGKFDIIITPSAGVRSAYEVLHALINALKNE